MRANEVESCIVCEKGVCHDGHVTFHRVRFERMGLDRKALNERIGLHHLFNGRAGPGLIEAFASNPDVASLIHEPASALICEDCAMRPDLCIMALAERAHARLDERKLIAAKPPTGVPDEDQDRRRGDRPLPENHRH